MYFFFVKFYVSLPARLALSVIHKTSLTLREKFYYQKSHARTHTPFYDLR